MRMGMGGGRSAVGHAVVGACGALAVSCSGTPPTQAAAPVASAVVAAAPLPPDLSEVAAPAHLAALVRWRNAQATFETIYQWTGIRLSPSDLAGEAYDKPLADTLAYDAPVDAAVAIDAKTNEGDTMPHVAVAFGVRSLENARRAAEGIGTVTEGRPGEYRVRVKPNKRHAERAFCVLSVAAGAAPARFICGQRERDVDALAPYLTRTLPRRDLGAADVHVELHPPALIDAYGTSIASALHFAAVYGPRRLQIGEPAFDRAIERAAAGLTDELGVAIRDVDEITIDVSLAPDHAAVDANLKLRTERSWTAGTLASEAGRAGPAPALFWRLPQTATGGGYQFTPDPSRFGEIHRTAGELLDGWLLHEGLAAADRTPLVAAVGEMFTHDTSWVSASGMFGDPAKPSPTPANARANQAEAAWERRWSVVGFPSSVPVGDMAKRIVNAINRPNVQATLRKSLAQLASAAGEPGGAPTSKGTLPVTVRNVSPPKGLPAGTLDLEVSFVRSAGRAGPLGASGATPAADAALVGKSARPAEKPTMTKAHVLIVGKPNESWMGIAVDRDKLVTVMSTVLDDGKGGPTLASRNDLEPLRAGQFVSASFATPEGLLGNWQSPLLDLLGVDGVDRKVNDARRALATAPHQGHSAMLLTTSIEASGPPNVHAHLDVPKGVIEDVIIAAASSFVQGNARP